MSKVESISPRLTAALAYAAAGIPIFPCIEGGKRPATANGFKDASTDPEVIRGWWSENDYNLAIEPEQAGWCVVDIDAVDIPPELDQNTRTVLTPRGGWHLYYEGSLPGTASKLAPKVDTRGRVSYALVPPSIVDGKPYRVVSEGPIAPLPAWVTEQLHSKMSPRMAAPDGVELDTPANVDRAKQFLARTYEKEGPWGQDDEPNAYVIACKVKDLGISPDRSVDLMMEHIGEDEREWLTQTVDNSFRYGQNEAGAWGVSEIPDAWQVMALANPPVPEKRDSGPFPPILSAATLSTMFFTPPRWVWSNRLLMGEPNLYTGDAGVGKTTLAENLAVAVAAGIPLLGHDTTQMPVLLLVAEDTYGPVRDNLLRIRGALQAPQEALNDIHVLSVKSDKVPGGHRLVTIADDGACTDSAFMREYLAPWLAARDGPVLFVIDPLSEFARFDRYKDEPCRSLATTWLDAVCMNGRVTPLVTDHPSKASMSSGEHYAGSVQLKAAFSLFATLKGGQWSGALTRQRDMIFSVLKGRYAGEEDTKFLRSSKSPAFILQGGPDHAPDDHQLAVYRHVLDRLTRQLAVSITNGGAYGPGEVALALQLDEKAAKGCLTALVVRQWLDRPKGAGGYVLGPKAPSVAELDGF